MALFLIALFALAVGAIRAAWHSFQGGHTLAGIGFVILALMLFGWIGNIKKDEETVGAKSK